MSHRALGALLAVLLVLAGCSSATTQDAATTTSSGDGTTTTAPDRETPGTGGGELSLADIKAQLTPEATEALDSVSRTFDPSEEEEVCLAEQLLDNLDALDDYDAADPEEVLAALDLAIACFGEETVVRGITEGILDEAPELDEAQARCVAEAVLDDDDLLAAVVLLDQDDRDPSVAEATALFSIFRSCDLTAALVQTLMEDADVPVTEAQGACMVDRLLSDESLIEAMLTDEDPFDTGDVDAMQSILQLLVDCDLGQVMADEMLASMAPGAEIDGEQATCFIAGMADDPTLLEAMSADEEDAAAVLRLLRIMRDCGLGQVFVQEMTQGADLTEEQMGCLLDEILAIDATEPGIDVERAMGVAAVRAVSTCDLPLDLFG